MKSRAERKARMMEIAEKEIEKMLDWQEKSERPDLSGIEEVFSPLDKQLDVKERNWSESISREATWLSGKAGSYEEAEAILKRIGRIEMDDSRGRGNAQRKINRLAPSRGGPPSTFTQS